MSDNYKALTRKYRPRSFDDIVSQGHVSNTLKNAIQQNRLSHAYMFCGPRGVGKTTMARVLARTVNEIDAQIDGEALGNTLNIIEIDAASNNKVEDVHRIRETVRIPPQNGRYKIYIIDEVHMLSKQAYNALLKTLEEPPAHVIFIFATTEPQKVLPTIMSRCQRFDFRRIKIEEIVSRLRFISDKEGITVDNESLHVIARKADGALRDALSIMDQAIAFCGLDIKHEELLRALNVVSSERLFRLMDIVKANDSDAGLQLIDDLLQEGHDIQEFLVSLTEHLRNQYLAISGNSMHLIEASEEMKSRYKNAASDFSEDDLMRMLHIVNETQYKVREAPQPRIQLEIAILKLIHMQKTDGLKHLIAELKKLQVSGINIPGSKANTTTEIETADRSHNQYSTSKPTDSPNNSAVQPSQPGTRGKSSESSQNKNAGIFGNPSLKNQTKNKLSYVSQTLHQGALSDSNNTKKDDKEQHVGNISGNLALAPNPKDQEQNLNQDSEDDSITIQEGPLYFHDIKEHWPKFLSKIEQQGHFSQVILITLKRLVPSDFKNGKLELVCNDEFHRNMVEENQRELQRLLRKYFKRPISLSCILNKSNNRQESYDPYTRFKKLQEKDPVVRTIVELFGAELEY